MFGGLLGKGAFGSLFLSNSNWDFNFQVKSSQARDYYIDPDMLSKLGIELLYIITILNRVFFIRLIYQAVGKHKIVLILEAFSREKMGFCPFKKKIQHFNPFPKLIREMPLF